MQQPYKWNVGGLVLEPDCRSKLVDGVLAACILCLLWLIVVLTIRPIQAIFGMPGLLVYVLGLMAVAMFSLQQAISQNHNESTRTWFGITGGFLSWSVMAVSANLGVPLLAGPSGAILPIMVSLIVLVLWRTVLPVGARFFSLTFLLNWAEFILMNAQEWLAGFSPVFLLIYRATGFLAVGAALLTLGWILFQSEQRTQRISAALALWFFISLAIYVFRGSLF